ncbi:efflux transporter outer membrane subunit [Acidithiobacillus sulfuriphilus]|uniref:Efflux transporter outer membrane subunit n=2 Tax=Acidithiobacillus sulfuriphilus TaxID=1867749 RepID=A0A3M8RT80_9PROT|nr:efflux transporter outer membrane subunit [Acidithiobacillus sulfuriphilus]RNF70972.1 efflux transporter outer membrane subunit [Acidithiobacillus sulfuriphilus]
MKTRPSIPLPSFRSGYRLLPLLAALGLAGCAVGPKLPAPTAPLPTRYNQHAVNGAQHLQWTEGQAQSWWHLFHSPALNRLIATATEHNPDLAAVQSSLAQAQALEGVANAGFLPQLGANLGAGRQRALRAGTNGGFGTRVPGNPYTLLLGSVGISYNPDVFGRQGYILKDARARSAVARAELHQGQVFLGGAVTQAVITAASAHAQVRLAQAMAQDDAQLLTLIRNEYRLGAQDLQTVDEQRAVTEAAAARIPPLQAAESAARHQLAALLGTVPDAPLSLPSLSELRLPTVIPTLVPSALVENRPDIQAARAETAAAAAEVGVATANLYPNMDISASLGKAAMTGGMFFDPASTLWAIGSSLAAPIYEGGALHAKKRAAMDHWRVATDLYRATVLNAFREVADALRAVQSADTAYTHSRAAARAAASAYQLALARYRDGAVDYATLLNAELEAQKDEIAAVQARAQRYLDNAALFVAMGDGWCTPRPSGPTAPARSSE